MFGDNGLCSLLEEGAHEKSPKCLDGNLGDFGEFCKGLKSSATARCICNCPSCTKCRLPTLPSKPRSAIKERPSAKQMAWVGSVSPTLFTTRYTSSSSPSLSTTTSTIPNRLPTVRTISAETFAKFLFPRQPKPQTQVFGCFRHQSLPNSTQIPP